MSDIGSPAEQKVFLGIWTNWSQGKTFGATITMTQYNGNLLIAFLALFVSFVGTSLWRIIGYMLHRIFSTNAAQDGVYHQRQAILRNAANATDAIWDLTSILWNSRRATHSYRRLMPSLATAVFSVSAFAVAGIFSSKMATLTGSEVLLNSALCGMPNGFVASTSEQLTVVQPWIAQRMTSAMNYANRCYFANAKMENCDYFVKPHLPSTVNRNASCPFDEDICRTQDGNIELDTGLIDSHYDLGYNGPNEKRMQFRRKMNCAPLKMENYTDSFVYESSVGNVSYKRYQYGSRYRKKGFNYTHIQPEISQDQLNMSIFKKTPGEYGVSFYQSYSFKGSLIPQVSEFNPIEQLRRGDADVALVFLAAGEVAFTAPVDDPWYSAHRPLNMVSSLALSEGKQQLYMADSSASVIGCAIQYQQCIPSLLEGEHCSKLGGLWETNQTISTESGWQFNMTQWIGTAFAESEVQYLVAALQAGSLTSRYSNMVGMQGPLPSDQWKNDVEQWHFATLAAAQASAVDYATGPGVNDPINQVWVTPDGEAEKYFCKNQKIRSNQYLNFSVFGLAFTMLVGSLIILLNYTLPSLVHSIEKRKAGGARHATLEWFATGTLQLQRLAHEGLGYGKWSKCDDEIPISSPNELLAVLDIHNSKHPRLKPSSTPADREDDRYKFASMDKGSVKHQEIIKQTNHPTIVHTTTERTLSDSIKVSPHPAVSK